ncbi:hypothetical protein V8E51_004060 [Hyaloscypha variabilis]
MATFPLVEISTVSPTPPTPLLQVHLPGHPEPANLNTETTGGQKNGPNRKNIRIKFSRRRKFFRVSASLKPETAKDGYKKILKVNLDKHPRGYPRTAVYVNSDDTTALFRRFGDLHSRSLLYKQAELTELEEKLAKIDQEDSQDLAASWKVGHSIHIKGGRRNDIRRDLIIEINEKLKEYGQLLLQDTQLRQLPKPSTRIFKNFFKWIYSENCFGAGEQNFLYHQHDFVILQEYENNWLDEKLNYLLSYCNRGTFRRIFSSSTDREKTADPHVRYHSSKRLKPFIKIIIAVTSTSLLLIPIFIFLSANVSVVRMAWITLLFSIAFATAISFFTNANRQDVFAITAAYCAVLVVFIGNLQQSQLSHSG